MPPWVKHFRRSPSFGQKSSVWHCCLKLSITQFFSNKARMMWVSSISYIKFIEETLAAFSFVQYFFCVCVRQIKPELLCGLFWLRKTSTITAIIDVPAVFLRSLQQCDENMRKQKFTASPCSGIVYAKYTSSANNVGYLDHFTSPCQLTFLLFVLHITPWVWCLFNTSLI